VIALAVVKDWPNADVSFELKTLLVRARRFVITLFAAPESTTPSLCCSKNTTKRRD